MSHEVETMAYNKIETPWHGLGFPVDDNLTPAAMQKAAKLDWTVSKRMACYSDGNGGMIKMPDEFALVRDSDNKKLSMVGTTYKPVQNDVAFDFFSRFVKAGKMKMETAGSLWGGRYIWALARINADFAVGHKGKDEIRSYLLLMSPHVHGYAMIIQYTPIRVVCWNTLCFALGPSLKGKGRAPAFRLSHSASFTDAVKEKAELVLGLAISEAEEFKTAAKMLSKAKATGEQVDEYFCEVLRWDPSRAKTKKDGSIRTPKALEKMRTALISAPGQDISTANGTWWGALNAVTNTIDYELGRDRETALRDAWIGERSALKRRAFDLAVERAL
jgi:phage/plasmid-like protein (TIGR03299 family)